MEATRGDPVAYNRSGRRSWCAPKVLRTPALTPKQGKQVTTSIVGAIGPKLEQVEIERARRKQLESLDSTHYYLRVV